MARQPYQRTGSVKDSRLPAKAMPSLKGSCGTVTGKGNVLASEGSPWPHCFVVGSFFVSAHP